MCVKRPKFLTTTQVSHMLQLTTQTIRNHCRSGKIDGAKNFGTELHPLWRIPIDSKYLKPTKETTYKPPQFKNLTLAQKVKIFTSSAESI